MFNDNILLRKINTFISIPIIALLILILSFSACSSEPDPGVKIQGGIVTVSNPICKFSFEYTGDYREGYSTVIDNYCHQLFSLTMEMPEKKAPSSESSEDYHSRYTYVPAQIEINIYDLSDRDETAWSRMTKKLDRLTEREHFKLYESTIIQVAGISAYQIIFSDSGIIFSDEDSWNRSVFFDYDGLYWELSVICDESMRDTVNSDFDTILDNFMLLN